MTIDDALKEMEKIKKTIDKIKIDVPKKAGEKLEKEVPHVMQRVMTEFYFSYSPEKYNRTLGLYNGILSGTLIRIDKNEVSIKVSSDNIPDHAHDTGKYIFEGAYVQGIHGDSGIFVSTPPKEILKEKLESMYTTFANNEIQRILKSM